MIDLQDMPDNTILGEDGRILLLSCRRFVDEVVLGEACFVCGASPQSKTFNDEHIIPRWVLKRYGLYDKEITLPTGERRHYRGYRVPCCVECNSLLGETVTCFHETLHVPRLVSPIVQAMLPWRMPRRS